VNILEAVRLVDSVRSAVVVTSDKCYEEKKDGRACRETDPMGGGDPYSSSKGCAELIVDSYRRSFFDGRLKCANYKAAVASVRAGNVIGGGDWAKDRLVPDCIRALVKGEKIHIRNPRHIRNWQFVLEPLAGYLWLGALLLEHGPQYAQGWNLGAEYKRHLSVDQVVQALIKCWGKGAYTSVAGDHLVEVPRLELDIRQAKKELQWHSIYPITKALETTVAWYRDYYQKHDKDMYMRAVKDIEDYGAAARRQKLLWAMQGAGSV
jgi:CDP-glucose 4,6-dehydratase